MGVASKPAASNIVIDGTAIGSSCPVRRAIRAGTTPALTAFDGPKSEESVIASITPTAVDARRREEATVNVWARSFKILAAYSLDTH